MRLTKKMLLTIETVVDIAYNSKVSPVSLHEISERHGIAKRYLEKMLRELKDHNILKSVRGTKGGYVIARERRTISLRDLLEVISKIEGQDQFYEYDSGSELSNKVIMPIWKDLNKDVLKKLQKITLEDLCRKGEKKNVPSKYENEIDYVI